MNTDELNKLINFIDSEHQQNMDELRQGLGLPNWFDTKSCTLLIPARLGMIIKTPPCWVRFCPYIPQDKMFAIKNSPDYINQGRMSFAS